MKNGKISWEEYTLMIQIQLHCFHYFSHIVYDEGELWMSNRFLIVFVASCCSIYTSWIRPGIMHSIELIIFFSKKLCFVFPLTQLIQRKNLEKHKFANFLGNVHQIFDIIKLKKKNHPALFISSAGVHNGKVSSWGSVAISIEINQSLCDLKHPLLLCSLPKRFVNVVELHRN